MFLKRNLTSEKFGTVDQMFFLYYKLYVDTVYHPLRRHNYKCIKQNGIKWVNPLLNARWSRIGTLPIKHI